jgi:hypothetical protein
VRVDEQVRRDVGVVGGEDDPHEQNISIHKKNTGNFISGIMYLFLGKSFKAATGF